MLDGYQNRMEEPAKRGRPPKNPPIPQETVIVSVPVVICPHCNHTEWWTVSGGKAGVGDTYKRCKRCGNTYVFQADGMIRRSGRVASVVQPD